MDKINYSHALYNRNFATFMSEMKAKVPVDPSNDISIEFYRGIIDGIDQFHYLPDDYNYDAEYTTYKTYITSCKGFPREYYWNGFCRGFHHELTEFKKYKQST